MKLLTDYSSVCDRKNSQSTNVTDGQTGGQTNTIEIPRSA